MEMSFSHFPLQLMGLWRYSLDARVPSWKHVYNCATHNGRGFSLLRRRGATGRKQNVKYLPGRKVVKEEPRF